MTGRRRRGFILALALSAGAHGAMVGGISTWERAVSPNAAQALMVDILDEQRDESASSWSEERPPRARIGEKRAACEKRALDTLAKSAERSGRKALGRPRPQKDTLTSNDLDSLRYQPYNHPTRDAVSRAMLKSGRVSEDNRALSPKPAKHRRRAPAKGLALLATGRTQKGGAMRSRKGPNSPDRSRASAPQRDDEARYQMEPKPLSQGKTGGERFSKAPLEGEAAPRLRHARARRGTTSAEHRRRGERAEGKRQPAASKQRLLHPLNMARTNDRGRHGGSGEGAMAGRKGSPEGAPKGLPIWLHTHDKRYIAYFRRIYARIQPRWRFPKALELSLEQGEVLLEFVVEPSGALKSIVIKRSSGFRAFDANAIAAVRLAAPFPPIPAHLSADSLRILAPFEFSNPLVR